MHLDFALFLQDLLRKAPRPPVLGLAFPSDELACTVWRKRVEELEVKDCPPSVSRGITTNFVFLVTGDCKSKVHQAVSPEPLADWICKFWASKENAGKEYFRLEVGGLGHLNAVHTDAYRLAFLKTVFGRGAEILFRPSGIVSKVRVSGNQGVPRAFSRDVILARAENAKNSDAALLLGQMKLREAGGSTEDLLMLLALLADEEIDVKPFLQGISSSEHVPYYLKRFISDSRLLAASCLCGEPGSCARGRNPAHRDEKAKQKSIGKPATDSVLLEDELRRAEDALLRFRFVYRQASEGAPEILVREVLHLVRTFYRYYNLPECRALMTHAAPSALALRAAELSDVLQTAVQQSLEALLGRQWRFENSKFPRADS